MKNAMKWSFLVILSLIAILVSQLTFTVHSVKSVLLQPYSWNGYLRESGVYAELPAKIPDMILPSDESGVNTGRTPASGTLVEDAWFYAAVSRAVDDVVTAAWLEEKFDLLLTGIWDFLLGKTDRLAQIPIPELKDAILREARNELNRLNMSPVNREMQLVLLQAQIPSALDLHEIYQLDDEVLLKLRKGYGQAGTVAQWLWGLLAVLVLAGALIAFYPVQAMRWLGYSALCAGALPVVAYGMIRRLNFWQPWERRLMEPLGEWEIVVSRFVLQVQGEVLAVMALFGAAALSIGIAAVTASHTPWMKRWNLKAQTRLAGRKLPVILRGTGLIAVFGAFAVMAAMKVIWQ